MRGFPILFTKRLQLRKLEPEDYPSLIKYANNKKISDKIINIPHPYREPDAAFRMHFIVQGFKKKIRYVFAIIVGATGEFIGEISLHLSDDKLKAELSYWVAEPFWNQGFATEAADALLKYGFEQLTIENIYASCYLSNIGSNRVLLKNGMTEQGARGDIVEYGIKKQR